MCNGAAVALCAGMPASSYLAVLVITTSLAACTSTTELGALTDRDLSISAGPTGVTLSLSYDGFDDGNASDCITLDSSVEATLDGLPFDMSSAGGGGTEPDSGEVACSHPQFTIEAAPPGPATIRIADASAEIDVTLPELFDARSLALPAGTTTIHAGSTIDLIASIPVSDAALQFDAGAFRTDGTEVFDVRGSGSTLTVPSEGLAFATQAEVTIEVYTQPAISQCTGAACTATTDTVGPSTTITFDP
jgi:hypothetical protein